MVVNVVVVPEIRLYHARAQRNGAASFEQEKNGSRATSSLHESGVGYMSDEPIRRRF